MCSQLECKVYWARIWGPQVKRLFPSQVSIPHILSIAYRFRFTQRRTSSRLMYCARRINARYRDVCHLSKVLPVVNLDVDVFRNISYDTRDAQSDSLTRQQPLEFRCVTDLFHLDYKIVQELHVLNCVISRTWNPGVRYVASQVTE